ncbi:MAG: hypothetical protein GY705_17840, partial [Bacteroidetes bacterium]|nr:hypothetical protein [Bacteroidota bacterium]
MAATNVNSTEVIRIAPVYIKHSDLGIEKGTWLKPYALIKELMNTLEAKDIEAAQQVGGLWKIHLYSIPARTKLFTQGLNFRGITVTVYENNPFVRTENDDPNKPRPLKVFVQRLPLTVANDEVKKMLHAMECQMIGDVQYDKEIDDAGKLTDFKNGNRVVNADTDHTLANPLPKFAYCGTYRVRIYHKGQKPEKKVCRNCLQTGYFHFFCNNPQVC